MRNVRTSFKTVHVRCVLNQQKSNMVSKHTTKLFIIQSATRFDQHGHHELHTRVKRLTPTCVNFTMLHKKYITLKSLSIKPIKLHIFWGFNIHSSSPFLENPNTVEVGYNVVRWAENFVSLQKIVVLTKEYNVTVGSEK